MGKPKSLRSKAVHFVSDLTTGLLNPISDKSSKLPQLAEDGSESRREQLKSESGSVSEEDKGYLVDGPDTSSFSAFLYSLLSSSESGNKSGSIKKTDDQEETSDSSTDMAMKESSGKRRWLSRGKQSLRAVYHVTKGFGFRTQNIISDSKIKSEDYDDDDDDGSDKFDGLEMRQMRSEAETVCCIDLPEMSEPSMLLTENNRNVLYASLPAILRGRKWILLYSTWRHGISISTLYRRSMIWPGLSLLTEGPSMGVLERNLDLVNKVVGDCKGAVFGGLVEAPLKPSNGRKYQGTNSTFVFTNLPGHPVIYRPTGANRYFTLCSTDYLAIGGGGHFALYLDGDMLTGSSAVSETYGNPCLAQTEDFEVKEVELWGFIYGSKYEEVLALSRTEAPGICRW